jgi:hypothetical protein
MKVDLNALCLISTEEKGRRHKRKISMRRQRQRWEITDQQLTYT